MGATKGTTKASHFPTTGVTQTAAGKPAAAPDGAVLVAPSGSAGLPAATIGYFYVNGVALGNSAGRLDLSQWGIQTIVAAVASIPGVAAKEALDGTISISSNGPLVIAGDSSVLAALGLKAGTF